MLNSRCMALNYGRHEFIPLSTVALSQSGRAAETPSDGKLVKGGPRLLRQQDAIGVCANGHGLDSASGESSVEAVLYVVKNVVARDPAVVLAAFVYLLKHVVSVPNERASSFLKFILGPAAVFQGGRRLVHNRGTLCRSEVWVQELCSHFSNRLPENWFKSAQGPDS